MRTTTLPVGDEPNHAARLRERSWSLSAWRGRSSSIRAWVSILAVGLFIAAAVAEAAPNVSERRSDADPAEPAATSPDSSDRERFVSQFPAQVREGFDYLSAGQQALIAFNGVTIAGAENASAPEAIASLVSLGHDYWFAGSASPPNFLIANGPGFQLQFSSDVRAIAFDASCFACDSPSNPGSLSFVARSAFGHVVESQSFPFPMLTSNAAHFGSFVASRPFRSVSVTRSGGGNWMIDDLRYVSSPANAPWVDTLGPEGTGLASPRLLQAADGTLALIATQTLGSTYGNEVFVRPGVADSWFASELGCCYPVDMETAPGQDGLYALTLSGAIFFRASLGGAWEQLAQLPEGTYLNGGIELDGQGRFWTVAPDAGVYRQGDAAEPIDFIPYNDGLPSPLATGGARTFLAVAGAGTGFVGTAFVGAPGTGVFRREPDSAAWELDLDSTVVESISSLAVLPNGDAVVSGCGTSVCGVYLRRSGSAEWVLTTGLDRANDVVGSGSTFFAGAQDGIYVLPAGTTAWLHLADAPMALSVSRLVVEPDGDFVVTAGSGVFERDSVAGEWLRITAGLHQSGGGTLQALRVDSTGRAHAVTDLGVWALEDDQVHWRAVNDGLQRSIRSSRDASLVRGMHGRLAFSDGDTVQVRFAEAEPWGPLPGLSGAPIALADSDAGDIYAVAGDQVNVLRAEEAQWEQLPPLEFLPRLIATASNGDVWVAGVSVGVVFVSRLQMGGTDWVSQPATGLSTFTVALGNRKMAIHGDGRVVLGTSSQLLELLPGATEWTEAAIATGSVFDLRRAAGGGVIIGCSAGVFILPEEGGEYLGPLEPHQTSALAVEVDASGNIFAAVNPGSIQILPAKIMVDGFE